MVMKESNRSDQLATRQEQNDRLAYYLKTVWNDKHVVAIERRERVDPAAKPGWRLRYEVGG